jgi:hypothetical protein
MRAARSRSPPPPVRKLGKGKIWEGLMERATEEGGYPYLCRATPLGFRLLPPCRGGAPELSIFVSPGLALKKLSNRAFPSGLSQGWFKTRAMQERKCVQEPNGPKFAGAMRVMGRPGNQTRPSCLFDLCCSVRDLVRN